MSGWYYNANVLVHLALIAVFGILLPWRKGLDFLDPQMISAYACLGMLFAAPAAAEAFSRQRPRSLRDALISLAKVVAYGEGLAILVLILGVATVSYSRGRPRYPELTGLAAAGLFGLLSALALSAMAGWLALRFSGAVARTSARAVFVAMLIGYYYYPEDLARYVLPGALGAAVLGVAMLVVLARQLQKPPAAAPAPPSILA
jgi:hypothetical protein